MENARDILFYTSAPTHASSIKKVSFLSRHRKVSRRDLIVEKRPSSYGTRIISYIREIPFLIRRWKRREIVWAWGLDCCLLTTIFCALNPNKIIVWDITDLQELQFGTGLFATLARFAETNLIRFAGHLVLSSPGFYESYYKFLIDHSRVTVVENLLSETEAAEYIPQPLEYRMPVTILYAGIFRSQHMLSLVKEICDEYNGTCRFVLAGIAGANISEELFKSVVNTRGVEYVGGYKPDDLPQLYQIAHFVFGLLDIRLDLNERVLLSNRLYHAGAFKRPIICTAGSTTGREAVKRGLGFEVPNEVATIGEILRSFSKSNRYKELIEAMPNRSDFIYDGQYAGVLDRLSVRPKRS